ncbi:MAG: SusE domain-containing protein [Bacteroidetes bacterium]|uniref:SusE domain-containing protein n=1 Tax=Candidatus Cryptobacteroides intestinavium TaxID=2840766 RepID=A0A9D9HIK5_9BACT|nr:SusE domain-containing protein [Candidatus Cryptobacteroides intestinavium]
MKLYRHLIALGTAAGLMVPGCTPEEGTLIDTGDELTLTASAKEITLLESKEKEEALKLTWTPASNYGLDEEADYTLEITKADSDYEDGYSRTMGKTTFSIIWTVEELNTFLTEQFNVESGTKTAYKARITATIYGRDDLT